MVVPLPPIAGASNDSVVDCVIWHHLEHVFEPVGCWTRSKGLDLDQFPLLVMCRSVMQT